MTGTPSPNIKGLSKGLHLQKKFIKTQHIFKLNWHYLESPQEGNSPFCVCLNYYERIVTASFVLEHLPFD